MLSEKYNELLSLKNDYSLGEKIKLNYDDLLSIHSSKIYDYITANSYQQCINDCDI